MSKEEHIRIKCTCGAVIDTKVLKRNDAKMVKEFMIKHLEHMHYGKKVNDFRIKYNEQTESFDGFDVFDEEWVIKRVAELMKKSEPDDVITIENVTKN